ncbi:MAG: hypothetical protein ACTMIY_13110, partial [Microbacterium gubbeenense]
MFASDLPAAASFSCGFLGFPSADIGDGELDEVRIAIVDACLLVIFLAGVLARPDRLPRGPVGLEFRAVDRDP